MTAQYFVFDDIDIEICNEILEKKLMKQKMLNKIRRKTKLKKQDFKLKQIRLQKNLVIIENYF